MTSQSNKKTEDKVFSYDELPYESFAFAQTQTNSVALDRAQLSHALQNTLERMAKQGLLVG